jgi:hypothetical protein
VLSQLTTADMPEHAMSPGLHCPVHWGMPLTTMHCFFGQVVTGPQLPVASQFWMPVPVVSHCVSMGAQTPEQLPLRQVWFKQGMAVPQVFPSSLHVCIAFALATHCLSPGLHTPHPPSKHTPAGAMQLVCVAQLPVLSQVWMALPRQRA